jgi:ribosomal protein S18 acetylase RimI-like enzyme
VRPLVRDAAADPAVRPARDADVDAVAPLLYETAPGLYDRYAGGRVRALRLLRKAFDEPGNNTSRDVVTVAEVEGSVAGALAAFPVAENSERAGAFMRLTLRTIPPWRWPGALWVYRAGARATPAPPMSALYIDALATDPRHRRRGVASALLGEAERRARGEGLASVALDTSLDNKPARALYLSAGYQEVAYRPPGRTLPGFVALVKEL